MWRGESGVRHNSIVFGSLLLAFNDCCEGTVTEKRIPHFKKLCKENHGTDAERRQRGTEAEL